MIDWVRDNEALVGWLLAASAVTFVATLILVPVLVVRIPADYFTDRRRHAPVPTRHPVMHVLLIAAKNAIGVVFIVAGVAMLVLPGQGILTLLIGVMLLSFPGKYRLERWLVTRRPVRRSVDWLRRRAGRTPLELP
jgi:hypothetical protein